MSDLKRYNEEEIYAAQVIKVGPLSDPVIDSVGGIFRLYFQVFQIHMKPFKCLQTVGKATGLLDAREDSRSLKKLGVNIHELGDIAKQLMDKCVRIQFTGKIPSGRQQFCIIGTFDKRKYRMMPLHNTPHPPIKISEITKLLGYSDNKWRRFIDKNQSSYPGLVKRVGDRKDRLINSHILYKVLVGYDSKLADTFRKKLNL